MHELALCDALLRMVRDISREEALDGVRSITVRVGTLSGVIPHFLTDCWVAVTDGTDSPHDLRRMPTLLPGFRQERRLSHI